ncbi:hypothetical protein GACE_1932 [Geoglobus acetivorans]|uniref:Uncharacterized protein n=1 Tax=Geoglobus acetivorans TaxID=565033 RepID=A0A0A7GJ22_GEOAI|nr:hypothetical protein GACE_1932 [Geoglobus acetivorans]
MENPVLLSLIKYLESVLIPVAFCLLYRKAKTFLVFLPMPVIMGYLFWIV